MFCFCLEIKILCSAELSMKKFYNLGVRDAMLAFLFCYPFPQHLEIMVSLLFSCYI